MQKKLLIVEDDKFLGEIYQHQFDKYGFATKLVEDGEEAVKQSTQEKFDCVLLDIMIPKMDGIRVLESFKANPKTKDLPVVVLSNLGQEEIIKKALSLGARAYIVKSLYTPDQIVTEVKSLLGV